MDSRGYHKVDGGTVGDRGVRQRILADDAAGCDGGAKCLSDCADRQTRAEQRVGGGGLGLSDYVRDSNGCAGGDPDIDHRIGCDRRVGRWTLANDLAGRNGGTGLLSDGPDGQACGRRRGSRAGTLDSENGACLSEADHVRDINERRASGNHEVNGGARICRGAGGGILAEDRSSRDCCVVLSGHRANGQADTCERGSSGTLGLPNHVGDGNWIDCYRKVDGGSGGHTCAARRVLGENCTSGSDIAGGENLSDGTDLEASGQESINGGALDRPKYVGHSRFAWTRFGGGITASAERQPGRKHYPENDQQERRGQELDFCSHQKLLIFEALHPIRLVWKARFCEPRRPPFSKAKYSIISFEATVKQTRCQR